MTPNRSHVARCVAGRITAARRFEEDTPAVPDCRTRHHWRGRGRRSSLGAAAPSCSPLCNWQNFHFRTAHPAPRPLLSNRAPRLISPIRCRRDDSSSDPAVNRPERKQRGGGSSKNETRRSRDFANFRTDLTTASVKGCRTGCNSERRLAFDSRRYKNPVNSKVFLHQLRIKYEPVPSHTSLPFVSNIFSSVFLMKANYYGRDENR